MEDRGTAALERRYRRWLRLYPREYRAEREEELLQTLLELSPPGRRRPAPREATALAVQGLRMRAKVAEPVAFRDTCLAVLPLTACLSMVTALVGLLLDVTSGWGGAIHPMTAENLVLVTWPGVPAGLLLVAVYRRKHRLATVLAAGWLLADVTLMARAGSFADTPDSPIAPAVVALVDDLLPIVLLLPLLLRPGAVPAPRRSQLGIPLLLAAPAVGLALVQRWPAEQASGSPLSSSLPVLLVLALLGVLLWGALVDGSVALAAGLCILLRGTWLLGSLGVSPVPWNVFAVYGGTGIAFAGVGAYRAHRQASR